jgi:hypothetical protein
MCKNDCILYREDEYKDIEKCPICGLADSIVEKMTGDDENCNRRNGGTKKMFCYFLIIHRLKRYFVDDTQWRNIDSQNPEFVIYLRNIRIAMSTYGMNSFMNTSTHSTWPIVMAILNLPPWLCNKQKYIMLSDLIPGP